MPIKLDPDERDRRAQIRKEKESKQRADYLASHMQYITLQIVRGRKSDYEKAAIRAGFVHRKKDGSAQIVKATGQPKPNLSQFFLAAGLSYAYDSRDFLITSDGLLIQPVAVSPDIADRVDMDILGLDDTDIDAAEMEKELNELESAKISADEKDQRTQEIKHKYMVRARNRRANAKKALKQVSLTLGYKLPDGDDLSARDILQAAADRRGISLRKYMISAAESYIAEHHLLDD